MKNIIACTFLALFLSNVSAQGTQPENKGSKFKVVCKTTVGKDGKEIKACRTIKVHKKLEGTPVPNKK